MTRSADRSWIARSDGTGLRLDRRRSDGILTFEDVALCKHEGAAMAFDPLQGGWVPAGVEDDLHVSKPVLQNDIRAGSKPSVADRLQLRSWSQTDLPRYRELLDDPLIWENMTEPYPDPLTEEMASALIEVSNSSNHHRVFALLKDGTPVGQLRVLFEVDPDDPQTAEISYWIGRDYWKQGLASVAVPSFAARCLKDHPGLTSLIARAKDENTASLRVLGKAGFVIERPDQRPGWTLLRKVRDDS